MTHVSVFLILFILGQSDSRVEVATMPMVSMEECGVVAKNLMSILINHTAVADIAAHCAEVKLTVKHGEKL